MVGSGNLLSNCFVSIMFNLQFLSNFCVCVCVWQIQIWSMDSCAQTRCPVNMTLILRTDTTTPEVFSLNFKKNKCLGLIFRPFNCSSGNGECYFNHFGLLYAFKILQSFHFLMKIELSFLTLFLDILLNCHIKLYL